MNHLKHVDELDLLVDENDHVLLFFTSSFCGPSRIVRTLLNTATEDFPEIVMVEIDVEDHPTITRDYQVKGTPELVMLKEGEPVSSRIGTMTFDDLLDYLEAEVPA